MGKIEKFFCWKTKEEHDINELSIYSKLENDNVGRIKNKNKLKIGLSKLGCEMIQEYNCISEENIRTNENEVKCPYCDYEFSDSEDEYTDDSFSYEDVLCDNCKKEFFVEVESVVIYKTYTKEYNELIKDKNIKKRVLEKVSRETSQIIQKENDTNE